MTALTNLRVIEIGSAAAASYCARMFADFGAHVTKIEPPAGDALRHTAPFTPKGASAWFVFLNAGKSSRVTQPGDAVALASLLKDCDVLIDGRGVDGADCPAIALDAIRATNPGLIHIEMSWFGHEGPYNDFQMSDVVCRALAGLNKLTGPDDGPPIAQPDFQTGIFAGLWGYIAATSALVARQQTGLGRALQLSIYESCIAIGEYLMFESWSKGEVMQRIGVNRFWPTFPVGIYETKDGWLGVTTVTPAQWMAFCDMLGLTDLRDDATLTMGVDRLQRIAFVEDQFIPRLKDKTALEWFAEGLKRKIPIVPVPSVADVIASDERRVRGAIVPVSIGDESGVMPGSMSRLRGTPPQAGGRAPAVGEEQGRRAPARIATTGNGEARELPLQGVRVVDFSMGWAGPLCTRTLADLGADVIKIESIQYADWWRGVDRRDAYVRGREYEKVPRFSMMNRNKRGVTLDLSRPAGVALAKRLVESADIVVDNYSVDVLPKLGLGYDVLSKIKPSLVMMSMSAFGSGSAFRDCRAYGSTLEQGSGVPSVVGEPDGPPTMQHTAFGDPTGGLNGASAVLTALLHARATGQGQVIDLSQIECMIPYAAPWIVAHAFDGNEPTRYGNAHPDHAPHGCFPCKADNSWIAIAVTSDAMWPKLATTIGFANDASLATAPGRRARDGEIAAAIRAWTAAREADAAMTELQAAGVAAGVLRAPIEMLGDAQLQARHFVQQVDRDFIGRHPEPSLPFRAGDRPYPVRAAAPTLGQHNADVLKGVLGLSDSEYDALLRDAIIGTEVPLPNATVPTTPTAR
ncbi:MAG: CoA transferase [Tardiphaga sp.]|nr:CoA transferase [Tardiphaga sp.]